MAKKRRFLKIRDLELEKIAKRERFLTKRVANMELRPIETMTFVSENGKKTVQKVNSFFFKDELGNPKTKQQIVKDISAIASDLNSKYVII